MSRQNVVVDKNTWIAVLKCIFPPSLSRLVFGGPATENDFKFFQIDWMKSLSDPFFVRWALTFTKTSLLPPADQISKQTDMLNFTKYAVNDMVDMFEDRRDDMSEKAGYNSRGSLAVSYDEQPAKKSNFDDDDIENKDPIRRDSVGGKFQKNTFEPKRKIESTDQILTEESSLKYQLRLPTSATYEYETKSASSGRFTKELARRCVVDPSLDVQFWYNTRVQGIATRNSTTSFIKKPRISEIRTNQGVISVPDDVHIVIAAGAWTPHVLALMGLYAPVYPLKGYALSVSAKEALSQANPVLKEKDLPSRIVCDKFMYTTRLGDEIRFTSIGEFSEWNTSPTPHVDADFRKEAIRQFPQLEHLINKAKTYVGHRPYVNDGILLLGQADTHDKLYVSCGPGSNGWKLAMGSGDIIARLVSGQTPQQIHDELGFDPSSFSPSGRVVEAPFFAKICRARWNV